MKVKKSIRPYSYQKGKKRISVIRHSRTYSKKDIERLAKQKGVYIPPAWEDVAFYDDEEYVATGIDDKGRRQYVYPKNFVQKRKNLKYKRIKRLESRIPKIMNQVTKDADKGNIEAQAVYTMYKTGFRPGTDKDTKADVKAYGTINLLKKHVDVKPGNIVEFDFIGKKGVDIEKKVRDARLAKIVKERKDDSRIFPTSEHKVRTYFDEKTHGDFMLKDLRTLKAQTTAKDVMEKSNGSVKEVKEAVAKELVNTPSVAMNSYIAPEIVK